MTTMPVNENRTSPLGTSDEPLKVLLVDDDLALRGVTAIHLRKAGYDVEVAVNGQEGLEKAQKRPPDVIVCDIMMPVMDGVEMLKRVRADDTTKYCYYLLLTAKDRTRDMLAGFDASSDDYVTKPFNMAELTARVKAGGRLKLAQDALRETNEKLQVALRQISELLGVAVHDLRNPISIITTYISLLGQDIVSDDSIKEVCLRRAQGLIGILDNLLDISKISAGKVSFIPGDLNLSLLAQESGELYRPVAQQRGVEIATTQAEHIYGCYDRKRMIEVFNTLFDIAIYLTPKDNTIVAELAYKDGGSVYTISTPGGGIGPDQIDALYNPEREMLDGYDATPLLGIAIVKKLIEMMSGEFFIESGGPDEGITFGFSLPGCEQRG